MPPTLKMAIRCLPLLIAATAFLGYRKQPVNTALFQIQVNGRTGFINSDGQVVIKPVFRSAGEFSEGLASARIDGLYGFIDATGEFVIQPQFEFATHFSEGLAVVFNEGKPFVINSSGQKMFDSVFAGIGEFRNGRAEVRTHTEKFGFIDKHGKLIIDTAFSSIGSFKDGRAVVDGLNHDPYRQNPSSRHFEQGVVDSLGNFIIPFGSYETIKSFKNGYFRARIPAEPWDTVSGVTAQSVLLDGDGKIVIAIDSANHYWIEGDVQCGRVRTGRYKSALSNKEKWTSETYLGYINLKGEPQITDTTLVHGKDFSNDRAIVMNAARQQMIIDTLGHLVTQERFENVAGDGFTDGFAIVKKNGLYGVIDLNGNFVAEPQFEGVQGVGIVNGYFFFREQHQVAEGVYELYGIARQDGTIVLDAVMENLDVTGFHNGLLTCIIDNKLSYVNESGRIVWQEPDHNHAPHENLNIDYMNRGYFYANSQSDKADFGEFAGSRNLPRKISAKNSFPKNALSIIAQPGPEHTTWDSLSAIAVEVVNTSKHKIEFYTQDNRLNMKVQAKDQKGQWRDIEYLPSSCCGNSYNAVTLPGRHQWTFATPVYEGDFATRLRIELKYIDPTEKSEGRFERNEITIYSNEYDGYVNPGQFWRKQEYFPAGIMNPYFD